MALAATTIFEVQLGGSDTANGGSFNPAQSGMASDGAATSATGSSPVFSSASYNFQSSDVGAWLFIQAGTNWIPGWYQIASVASNKATLNAGTGSAILCNGSYAPVGFNSSAGCASTASPTGCSWTIDYSQSGSSLSLTGLTTSGASAVVLTLSATVAMIGNGVVITGGTNFTTGYYQITAVSAGASFTFDRTATTGTGASGAAGIGGALASPAMAASLISVAQITVFVKYNASVYPLTVATDNVSTGQIYPGYFSYFCGYSTARFLFNNDTNIPTIQIQSGVANAIMVRGLNSPFIQSIIFDANNQSNSVGLYNGITAFKCTLKNFTSFGTYAGLAIYCYYTGNSSYSSFYTDCYWCEASGNSSTPFYASEDRVTWYKCLSYNNTSAYGYILGSNSQNVMEGCVAYNNSSGGLYISGPGILVTNFIAESNGGYGVNNQSGVPVFLQNYASYNNTSGRSNGSVFDEKGIQYSSSAFVAASSGNFALNNTSGGGASLRAAGFPAAFPTGLTASYPDIGAAQHQASSGGSGSVLPQLLRSNTWDYLE